MELLHNLYARSVPIQPQSDNYIANHCIVVTLTFVDVADYDEDLTTFRDLKHAHKTAAIQSP